MTVHDFYQRVSYFFNHDSEILRSKIERLVMIQHALSWDSELTDENFKLIREA